VDDLIAGRVHDPHAILGGHPSDGQTLVRTLRRGAGSVAVLAGGERYEARRVHDE